MRVMGKHRKLTSLINNSNSGISEMFSSFIFIINIISHILEEHKTIE